MDISPDGDDKPRPIEVGFAPKDLTDGRAPGDWMSRYGTPAWRKICFEGAYLLILLGTYVVAIVLVWLGYPARWLNLNADRAPTFAHYAYSWLGGTIGGVLFSMKWLYHSIGKTTWHVDRAPWRYLTPHISGGLAFATLLILNALVGTGQNATMSGARSLATGILVGLFSDNALAKLTEVAETLLGPTRRLTPPVAPAKDTPTRPGKKDSTEK